MGSPKDVFNNDSVPPSTSFTNLTTPGSTYLETPEEEFQTSPLFSDNLGYGGGNQNDTWFPLFPETEATPAPPAMERTISASSAAQVMVHPGGESLHRKRSSTTTSPTFSPVVKHSSVAGVAARKRDKPLPPIMVDDSDPVARSVRAIPLLLASHERRRWLSVRTWRPRLLTSSRKSSTGRPSHSVRASRLLKSKAAAPHLSK